MSIGEHKIFSCAICVSELKAFARTCFFFAIEASACGKELGVAAVGVTSSKASGADVRCISGSSFFVAMVSLSEICPDCCCLSDCAVCRVASAAISVPAGSSIEVCETFCEDGDTIVVAAS